ncbi:hypothetical protein ACFQ0M_24695 [Kitasatospora aburaviensis]
MRTSVINRFAKNDRAFSGRRTLAALATTVVVAGGVQILTTDAAWACGDIRYGTPPAIDSSAANKAVAPVADFRAPSPPPSAPTARGPNSVWGWPTSPAPSCRRSSRASVWRA